MKHSAEQKGLRLSSLRRTYLIRLGGRIVILLTIICIYFSAPEQLETLYGMNFFQRFSFLHILWIIWMLDMVQQLLPISRKIALGSQKMFRHRYQAVSENFDRTALKASAASATRQAYKIFVLWSAFIAVLGILHFLKWLSHVQLFLISVCFYVCDLICVLFWCPFRLIMKNRCCTTCRIFNWDHLMMFTPMLFIKGFYTYSLLIVAAMIWASWELCVIIHPERFSEQTNKALRCSACTDKLCSQYCRNNL